MMLDWTSFDRIRSRSAQPVEKLLQPAAGAISHDHKSRVSTSRNSSSFDRREKERAKPFVSIRRVGRNLPLRALGLRKKGLGRVRSRPSYAFGKAHPLSALLNIHENLRLNVRYRVAESPPASRYHLDFVYPALLSLERRAALSTLRDL